jgi:hypothetical protein
MSMVMKTRGPVKAVSVKAGWASAWASSAGAERIRVRCMLPSDPTVSLAFFSFIFLLVYPIHRWVSVLGFVLSRCWIICFSLARRREGEQIEVDDVDRSNIVSFLFLPII